MTAALNDENNTLPRGAITHDQIEKYAVFVDKGDAETFGRQNSGWKVDWCVESPTAASLASPQLVQVPIAS